MIHHPPLKLYKLTVNSYVYDFSYNYYYYCVYMYVRVCLCKLVRNKTASCTMNYYYSSAPVTNFNVSVFGFCNIISH